MKKKPIHRKDRLKDRSDIGQVETPIEKLTRFRDASASCVHIEAAMDTGHSLINQARKRPK